IGDLFAMLGRGGHALVRMFTETDEAPVIAQDGVARPRRPQVSAEVDGLPADVPRINPRADGRLPAAPQGASVVGAPPPAAPRVLGMEPALPAAAPPAGATAPGKKGKTEGDGARGGAEVAKQLALPVAGPSGMLWKLPEITLLERASEVEINDADLMQKARK